MPGATNRFVTVTGDVYRTGEIPNDETAMTTLLDSLMKRNKQVIVITSLLEYYGE